METFQNLFRTKSPIEFLKNAKSKGFKIIGTGLQSGNSDQIKTSLDSKSPSILLLGNEGSGLSSDILNLCDTNITINPFSTDTENYENNNLDSLNVGVATGILLDRLRYRKFA